MAARHVPDRPAGHRHRARPSIPACTCSATASAETSPRTFKAVRSAARSSTSTAAPTTCEPAAGGTELQHGRADHAADHRPVRRTRRVATASRQRDDDHVQGPRQHHGHRVRPVGDGQSEERQHQHQSAHRVRDRSEIPATRMCTSARRCGSSWTDPLPLRYHPSPRSGAYAGDQAIAVDGTGVYNGLDDLAVSRASRSVLPASSAASRRERDPRQLHRHGRRDRQRRRTCNRHDAHHDLPGADDQRIPAGLDGQPTGIPGQPVDGERRKRNRLHLDGQQTAPGLQMDATGAISGTPTADRDLQPDDHASPTPSGT